MDENGFAHKPFTPGRFEQGCTALQNDRSQGASALARHALVLLEREALAQQGADPATFCATMGRCCDTLAQLRPSMTVIGTQVRRWHTELERVCAEQPAGAPATHMVHYAAQLLAASERACAAAAQHMASIIRPDSTIITLSSSSTLNAVFRLLPARVRVIVAESRPLNEGVTVVQQLLQRGFEAILITEAQLGLFVAQADMALIGADSILADGTVVNKVGSYLLALAAHAAGVDMYCCHERFKECFLTRAEFEIEAMDVAELGHVEVPAAAQRNLYFDCTPAHLISARVTEHGMVMRE